MDASQGAVVSRRKARVCGCPWCCIQRMRELVERLATDKRLTEAERVTLRHGLHSALSLAWASVEDEADGRTTVH